MASSFFSFFFPKNSDGIFGLTEWNGTIDMTCEKYQSINHNPYSLLEKFDRISAFIIVFEELIAKRQLIN